MRDFGQVEWNEELINKYNLSGPRYTSYPTALQFVENSNLSLVDAIRALPDKQPLSLYFHIPFCNTICYYCACNKVVTKDKARANRYLDSLYKEIEMVAKVSGDRPVKQIHLGGGTPTFLSDQQLVDLMAKVNQAFNVSSDSENAIEIDPRTITEKTLVALKNAGFNRLSFGVQDFNADVQVAVNRVQRYEQVKSLLDVARDLGFVSINIDLIYGLPFQTQESFRDTIEKVIALKAERLSIFNYAHLPHRFKPQRKIKEENLPSPSEKLEILKSTIAQLTNSEYVYIGMDHFALPDDELAIAQKSGHLHRNFQGYTTRGECELIGLGVSSISHVGHTYSQNQRTLEEYYACVEQGEMPFWRGAEMDEDDVIRRAVIMQLICHFELDVVSIEKQFAIAFDTYFAPEMNMLRQFESDGLICINDGMISVPPLGRLFIRNICMIFDKYFWQSQQVNQYSRVI